jgi:predicted N-acetyltransferase YhbS
MYITVRPIQSSDVEACGTILFEAFTRLTKNHGYPSDFQIPAEAIQVIQSYIEDPYIFGSVALSDERVVGSAFLHKRDSIYAVGPVSVDPKTQQQGIGLKLTQSLIEEGKDIASIRLLQDTFNVAAIGMYSSLGFNVTQPLLLMHGKPKEKLTSTIEVRPLELNDIEECGKLCKKILGFDRTQALCDNLKHASAFVAIRQQKIVAYTSAINFWQDNHSVAISDEDLCALILGAAPLCQASFSFLVPTLRSDFLRWCLKQGFRGLSPRTQMVYGHYQPPNGSYLQSALY